MAVASPPQKPRNRKSEIDGNPAPQGPGAGVSQAQPQAFSSPGAQGSQAGVNRKKQSILDVLREILSTPAFSRDKIIDDWVNESRVAPFVVIVTDEYKLIIEQKISTYRIYLIDLKAKDERVLIYVRHKCKHVVLELDDDERVDIAYRAGESLAKVIDAYEKSLKKCNPGDEGRGPHWRIPSEETYIYLTEDDIIKIEKSESDAYPSRYNIIAIMPHGRAKLFRECYVEFGLRDHIIEIDPAITEIYDLGDAELFVKEIKSKHQSESNE